MKTNRAKKTREIKETTYTFAGQRQQNGAFESVTITAHTHAGTYPITLGREKLEELADLMSKDPSLSQPPLRRFRKPPTEEFEIPARLLWGRLS